MLDITKLQTAQASNEQIATVKRLYQDLEKSYDLGLFVKPDHIRIYVGHWGWLGIAKNGRIGLHLDKFQGKKIIEKLTPEITALLIQTKKENSRV
jgi:hypothetical protein